MSTTQQFNTAFAIVTPTSAQQIQSNTTFAIVKPQITQPSTTVTGTLHATLIASGNLYIPLPNNIIPNGIFIRGFSSYDTELSTYNVSYTVQYSSYQSSYIAFVPFPQAVLFQSTGLAYTNFDTENIIDETYFSMIPPFLLKFYDNEIQTEQVGSFPYISVISLIYYNDDVLFMLQVPTGIVIYSYNKNEFYKIKLPVGYTENINAIYSTFLENNIYTIVAYGTNPINVVLLQATFTYSDTVLQLIQQFSISTTRQYYSVEIVGTLNYVIGIVRVSDSYFPNLGSPLGGEIYYYVYDTVTQSITTYNTGNLSGFTITVGSTTISQIPTIFGIKTASVYAYYVFTMMFDANLNELVIVSLDLKTGSFEYAYIPNTNINTTAIEPFIQGNQLILITIPQNLPSPIQQGNVWFLPLPYQVYELTTREMVTIQFTEIVLEKNELTIKGYVYLTLTGEPVQGGAVAIFETQSAMGNQIGILGKALKTTNTANDGSFTLKYTFPTSPQDANITIVASVDPVITELVIKSTQVIPYIRPY